MKKEDVPGDIIPASSTALPEAANKAVSVVLEAVKSFWTVYDEDIKDLVERHGDFGGELIVGKVGFVLTDLPYKVRN